MYLAINLREYRTNEEKRKREVKSKLQQGVSAWPTLEKSSLPCISLLDYYPSGSDDLTDTDLQIQHLIWDFKASPPFPCNNKEILRRHKKATMFILPFVVDIINHYFNDLTKDLILACVPATSKEVNDRRFCDFTRQLCKRTGMKNGYNHVRITKDGEATHHYFDDAEPVIYVIDKKFFTGKNVLIFDDNVTTGASIERFKNKLENAGSHVIGAITIGRTCHHYKD